MNITETVKNITSTVGVSYLDKTGELIPVSFSKLDDIIPLHPKAVTRLYVMYLQQGGMPKYHVLGVITGPMKLSEVSGMRLKGEYTDIKGFVRQIWVNEEEFHRVRVTIPTTRYSMPACRDIN
jgi:hypothetical protein